MSTNVFAVFVVANISFGRKYFAATTRDDGRIGLPGGKVDAGETPVQAAIRESREEGWDIVVHNTTPIHQDIIDGKLVQWFAGELPRKLSDYKEKDRGIKAIAVSRDTIANSGFGNEFIKSL